MALVRYRFSVDDYYRMADAGVLGENDRVELLEGEIVMMSPISSPHSACVSRVNVQLVEGLHGRAIVRVQDPVRLDGFSEPQPDLALVHPRADDYADGHPGPADVLLLVEVADSSLVSDRRFKLPLYARFGIVEVWLVDLGAGCIEVHTEPTVTGYATVQTALPGESVTPRAFADLVLAVRDLLP